jgi:class 3 adenylate cyclase/tetratricopeptide (TPR) repeat protein
MRCWSCNYETPVEAKFCEQCGAPRARVCAHCGSYASPTAKFCPQCGRSLIGVAGDSRFVSPKSYTPQHLADKMFTARAALKGERKQVTVLFADIKGSMELFADRDPEAAQKIFDPVLERMIEAVHRYEGTVNRVMGDGIMALFGAPIAHEDHAVRACYAGLRMQEAVRRYGDEAQQSHGVATTIRVGLNSGEIVVCGISNDLHIDYTVVGQTANLAARLEQMAQPGSILTTSDTVHLAEGYVAVKPLGPVSVKGLADPVQIYEITGTGTGRSRLEVAAERGLTPFVGRDVELQQLRRAQQLAGQGRGQVVAIVGEPGVGKSRLVREFVRLRHAADWLILESKSASYSHAAPYLSIIELLKDYFKIDIHDSTQCIRERVVGSILTLDATLQDAIPPVLDLLDSLGDDDPFRSLDLVERQQSIYQAVVRLLLSESRVRPVIAIFEDLHRNDALSLGLLDELVITAQDARLLLVVHYRPEFKDEWRNRPNYRQFRVDPFVSEDLAEFLQVLLGSDENLSTLKSFLVERASGNPFFVEEIVRRLVGTGVLEGMRGSYRLARPFSCTEVPPTIQAVLAARVDALPAATKHLLEEAAVIGHDAPFALLHAICELAEDQVRGLLDNLQTAEFLYTTQLFPELQYKFKHSLTHDVVYSGMLQQRRRAIHARVVDAIEGLYADRLAEHVERLAYHAVQGTLNEKAVHYLREAGAKAAMRSALPDARAWFEQALDILKSLPESQAVLEQAVDIRLELRPVLRQLGEGRKMLEHLCEAEAISERLKDDRRRGQVCAFMTTVLSTFDDLDEALVAGNRAREIAHHLGDLRLLILATSHLEQAHYYRGEYEHVIEFIADSLAAMPADWAYECFGGAVPASVFGRAYLIMSLGEIGRFAEAAKYDMEAIQLVQATQHAYTVAWACFAASMLHLLKGDWAKARSQIDKWIATLQRGNIQLPWALASSAWVLAQIGEASEALKRVREGEQLLEDQVARGIVAHRSWAYHAVGRTCLLLGRLDDAQHMGDRSVEFAQRQPGFAAHALHLLGDIAAHPNRFDAERSATHYRRALTLAQMHGMRPLVAHCHLGLGTLCRRVGEPERAHEHLTTAATMYREMGMCFWLEQARVDLSDSGHVRPAVDVLGVSR